MARFLFVVPPLAGHVNPTISVGRELSRRGHEVAWAGPPGVTDRLLPDDAPFFAAGSGSIADAADQRREQLRSLRYVAALKFLWEEVLIPLGHAMVDDLDAVVDSWRPDVVVADQQALAGAAVARRRGLRWATAATTSSEFVDPLSSLPQVEHWVRDQIAAFQADVGVPQEATVISDLRFSEHLVLVFSTPQMVGRSGFPSHYAFVGPSVTDRPEPQPFPWEWLDPSLPHVVVSLGTFDLRAGERFLTVAAEALAGEPLQAILVAPPHVLGEHSSAGNLLALERVPLLRLLGSIDAVVCHSGHNTVTEALSNGIPLVLAPVVNDEPIVADQVVRAGAGIRVHFTRVEASELRKAVRRVMHEPAFGRAAALVQESFRVAGGAPAAAAQLEALATTDEGAHHGPPAQQAGTVP